MPEQRRYPPWLRRLIVRFWKDFEGNGGSRRAFLSLVRVSDSSLRRWSREETKLKLSDRVDSPRCRVLLAGCTVGSFVLAALVFCSSGPLKAKSHRAQEPLLAAKAEQRPEQSRSRHEDVLDAILTLASHGYEIPRRDPDLSQLGRPESLGASLSEATPVLDLRVGNRFVF